ncbi:unnamed protein product [Anisakis simplex]|uniref:Protein Wnt n=1 Tax=Anisakis simplex TaxID=6269 RepID=A0A0M3JWY5_ANISI|nr:unnamed protein product [Anisakis simplex]
MVETKRNDKRTTQLVVHNWVFSGELLHLRSYRHFHVLCRTQPAIAVAAYEGIQDAMSACREHMRFQPWDCSHISTVLHDPPILRLGTRETAYLWAMSSAGAAWGVSTACAQGWLTECACNGRAHKKENWEWGGCSYGVQFGIVTSRKLLTRHTSSRSPLRKLEKHNLKAGRLEWLKFNYELYNACKLSTPIRTPLMTPPRKEKLISGRQKNPHLILQMSRQVPGTMPRRRHCKFAKRLVEENTRARNAELVFVEDSPDPCLTMRITNRVCNWRNETSSVGDCGLLCCGHPFKARFFGQYFHFSFLKIPSNNQAFG